MCTAVGNLSALRMWGNVSHGFVVPRGPQINSIAMWMNWYWGDATILEISGLLTMCFYRQFIKIMQPIEWTPYPLQCSYVSPGQWHHVAMDFSSHGASLYIDGQLCTKSRIDDADYTQIEPIGTAPPPAGWMAHKDEYCSDHGGSRVFEASQLTLDQCAAKCAAPATSTTGAGSGAGSGAGQCACFDFDHRGGKCRGVDDVVLKPSSGGLTAYTKTGPPGPPGPPSPPAPPPGPPGPSPPAPAPGPPLSKGDLRIGGWSGLISDVRVWSGKVEATTIAGLYSVGAAMYNQTAVQLPSPQSVREANRSWSLDDIAITEQTRSMYSAWLQRNTSSDPAVTATQPRHPFRHLKWSGATTSPVMSSAMMEIKSILDVSSTIASTQTTGGISEDYSLSVGTCEDWHIQDAFSQLGTTCPVQGQEEAFAIQSMHDVGHPPRALLVGGGSAGVLYHFNGQLC